MSPARRRRTQPRLQWCRVCLIPVDVVDNKRPYHPEHDFTRQELPVLHAIDLAWDRPPLSPIPRRTA